MKSKNSILLVLLSLTLLGTAACSRNDNQSVAKPTSTSHKGASLNVVKHRHQSKNTGTLSANNISPQENVSIITVYAANKYGDSWQKVLKEATNQPLNVTLESRDSASGSYKGQGYIYQVSAGDASSSTCYTLDGNGSSQMIYLYDGDHYLGSSTVREIVDYLNRNNYDSEVKALMQRVKIGSQSADSDSSTNDSNDKSNSKSSIPGDEGAFTVPMNLRGVWYDKSGEKLIITDHAMSSEGNTTELRKQDPNFSDQEKESKSIQDKTAQLGAANMTTVSGFRCMCVAGWTQIDGSRRLFASHSEKGEPVLLGIFSGGGLQNIFWKSPQLAKKYSDAKFSDLKELGGIMND